MKGEQGEYFDREKLYPIWENILRDYPSINHVYIDGSRDLRASNEEDHPSKKVGGVIVIEHVGFLRGTHRYQVWDAMSVVSRDEIIQAENRKRSVKDVFQHGTSIGHDDDEVHKEIPKVENCYCGGKGFQENISGFVYYVCCDQCGFSISGDDDHEAVKGWNDLMRKISNGEEMRKRMQQGRDYLRQVDPSEMTVESVFKAFGWKFCTEWRHTDV